ncbi:hypothetical protein CSTERLE_01395 [Thermoclostridium stercorarium subsp. leptospartum DSM 9219]|uniref:Uncharacterized protein n=1 Tax=Thermoclostridium stercorarium subsp. leptospartum DSM 9219 TaxID=1346611 RepID=A0A1B1YHT6_THEST|nr:hypothetical protein [Thermoclostridium stercorarium]ANX00340.1 hypothetical protein CSTERLE_01395 [Thermoclostridium stercorarium subsp. leptospartum DSM 9219]
MTFSIEVIKEKCMDSVFWLNVSVYGHNIKVKDAKVEVIRRAPKVTFNYPDELKDVLAPTDQKKLELEMLNKIVEYMIETSKDSIIRAPSK